MHINAHTCKSSRQWRIQRSLLINSEMRDCLPSWQRGEGGGVWLSRWTQRPFLLNFKPMDMRCPGFWSTCSFVHFLAFLLCKFWSRLDDNACTCLYHYYLGLWNMCTKQVFFVACFDVWPFGCSHVLLVCWVSWECCVVLLQWNGRSMLVGQNMKYTTYVTLFFFL